jgi:hypothetical protein
MPETRSSSMMARSPSAAAEGPSTVRVYVPGASVSNVARSVVVRDDENV